MPNKKNRTGAEEEPHTSSLYSLQIANSLWAGDSLPLKEAFAGRLRDEYVRISINEEKALFKLKEIWSYLRRSFPESNIWDRQMKVAGDLETFLYGMRNLLDTYDPEKIPEKRGIPGLHNR